MAVSLYQQNNKISYGVCQFVCDTEEDLKKICAPKPGSTAYVIEKKEVYMMGNKNVWHSMTGNGSCDCNCVSELTIWDDIKA